MNQSKIVDHLSSSKICDCWQKIRYFLNETELELLEIKHKTYDQINATIAKMTDKTI